MTFKSASVLRIVVKAHISGFKSTAMQLHHHLVAKHQTFVKYIYLNLVKLYFHSFKFWRKLNSLTFNSASVILVKAHIRGFKCAAMQFHHHLVAKRHVSISTHFHSATLCLSALIDLENYITVPPHNNSRPPPTRSQPIIS